MQIVNDFVTSYLCKMCISLLLFDNIIIVIASAAQRQQSGSFKRAFLESGIHLLLLTYCIIKLQKLIRIYGLLKSVAIILS